MSIKCPICDKIFKEINNSHLSKHNLTSTEFNILYPIFNRYSSPTRNSEKYKEENKWLDKKENIDFIICPICNKKLKEINNAHLNIHNLTADQFDKHYPNNKRLSESVDKNNFKNLTKEISDKLKKSHTLENYINKYGDENGRIKFQEKTENVKKCKNRQYYINIHGEKNGNDIFSKIQKSKGVTLEKYIGIYGEIDGTNNYNTYREDNKNKKKLEYYIIKYGENDGIKKWFEKNNKISKSNRKVSIDKLKEFEVYKILVDKFTRLSLQMYNIDNLDKRSKKYHLDHKYSKTDGFLNNISAEIVGHISNLEIVDQHYNSSKQHRSDIEIEVIREQYNNDILYQERCEKLKS